MQRFCISTRSLAKGARNLLNGNQYRVAARTASRSTATQANAAKFARQRIDSLGGDKALAEFFPRWKLPQHHDTLTAAEFLARSDDAEHTVYGRVTSRRKQGSKLMFIDLESGRTNLQVVLNEQEIGNVAGAHENFQRFRKTVRRGDWLAVAGSRYATSTGQISLLASRLPRIVSVSLQPLPETLSDTTVLNRDRHVDRILHPHTNDPLLLRHLLIARLRKFLMQRSFIEVSTPLLTAGFGGAIARPFETVSSELSDTKLNLRIAPELWLKRLTVGNMERVFEIGPAFRNEGVDLTHNPEFTICEFYQVATDLDSLMSDTELLFQEFADESRQARMKLKSLPDPDEIGFRESFDRISFIPALEAAIREKLPAWEFPALEDPSAAQALMEATEAFKIAVSAPEPVSPPKLLDALSSELLESKIVRPTWITHHPECMSPLAKSFAHDMADDPPATHRVSARAELFIRGREYVNCYEEENSPIEQRKKFEEQLRHRNTEGDAVVDENYISVLEWGMPPTGGWGCGIDRIVMLFSGRGRIADVLPFGTITNVAALGTRRTEDNVTSRDK